MTAPKSTPTVRPATSSSPTETARSPSFSEFEEIEINDLLTALDPVITERKTEQPPPKQKRTA